LIDINEFTAAATATAGECKLMMMMMTTIIAYNYVTNGRRKAIGSIRHGSRHRKLDGLNFAAGRA